MLTVKGLEVGESFIYKRDLKNAEELFDTVDIKTVNERDGKRIISNGCDNRYVESFNEEEEVFRVKK